MWFGEPHPFPERGSPTGLSALRVTKHDRVEYEINIIFFGGGGTTLYSHALQMWYISMLSKYIKQISRAVSHCVLAHVKASF